jgi:hypothetical protein
MQFLHEYTYDSRAAYYPENYRTTSVQWVCEEGGFDVASCYRLAWYMSEYLSRWQSESVCTTTTDDDFGGNLAELAMELGYPGKPQWGLPNWYEETPGPKPPAPDSEESPGPY